MLIRLAVECPECGRRPNLRIFRSALEKHRDDDPETPVQTHQCTGCGEVYVITARAFQESEAA